MRYQNITDQPLTIIGVGEVGPGGFIDSLYSLNIASLRLVPMSSGETPNVNPASTPEPAIVNQEPEVIAEPEQPKEPIQPQDQPNNQE